MHAWSAPHGPAPVVAAQVVVPRPGRFPARPEALPLLPLERHAVSAAPIVASVAAGPVYVAAAGRTTRVSTHRRFTLQRRTWTQMSRSVAACLAIVAAEVFVATPRVGEGGVVQRASLVVVASVAACRHRGGRRHRHRGRDSCARVVVQARPVDRANTTRSRGSEKVDLGAVEAAAPAPALVPPRSVASQRARAAQCPLDVSRATPRSRSATRIGAWHQRAQPPRA